jgi:hypothetical protein
VWPVAKKIDKIGDLYVKQIWKDGTHDFGPFIASVLKR